MCIKKGNLFDLSSTKFNSVFYWKFLFTTINTLVEDYEKLWLIDVLAKYFFTKQLAI